MQEESVEVELNCNAADWNDVLVVIYLSKRELSHMNECSIQT